MDVSITLFDCVFLTFISIGEIIYCWQVHWKRLKTFTCCLLAERLCWIPASWCTLGAVSGVKNDNTRRVLWSGCRWRWRWWGWQSHVICHRWHGITWWDTPGCRCWHDRCRTEGACVEAESWRRRLRGGLGRRWRRHRRVEYNDTVKRLLVRFWRGQWEPEHFNDAQSIVVVIRAGWSSLFWGALIRCSWMLLSVAACIVLFGSITGNGLFLYVFIYIFAIFRWQKKQKGWCVTQILLLQSVPCHIYVVSFRTVKMW